MIPSVRHTLVLWTPLCIRRVFRSEAAGHMEYIEYPRPKGDPNNPGSPPKSRRSIVETDRPFPPPTFSRSDSGIYQYPILNKSNRLPP